MGENLEQATATFVDVRPRLFGIAYRMLGSVAEAEDVVQDAWLRWQGTDRTVVENPVAFLATTTTRLAINVVESARERRETYVGPWLPEPVDTSVDPALGAERGEALELAVLMLLEKLTPRERAAYVLREAFDYGYADIADVLEISEANARQLVSRARGGSAGRAEPVTRPTTGACSRRSCGLPRTGDVAALERLLVADAVSTTDGGGVVRKAARVPVSGRDRVARLHAGFAADFWPGAELVWIEANGRPAALVRRDGVPVAQLSIETTVDGVAQAMWMMNPEKLRRIAA